MDRKEYLEDVHVAGFVKWLTAVIVADKGFTQSFYPRNGRGQIEVSLTSFRDAVNAYDFAGQDLGTTQIVLDEMAAGIKQSIINVNEVPDVAQQHTLLIACLQTLVWGGVTVKSTIDWLANSAQEGALHEAIRIGSQALISDKLEALEPFKDTKYLRSDSAATKLYALADNRSIIYDNRVAAALAKLVCEYLDQSEIDELPDSLAFMVKRNDIRRNPSIEPNRIFDSKVTGYAHARWNQRANWIINSLVQHSDIVRAMGLFMDVNPIREIEAALFVMGDDVRNMSVSRVVLLSEEIPLIPEEICGRAVHHGCIPTNHDFGKIIQKFSEFRENNPGSDDLSAFRDCLIHSMGVLPSTAGNYCYPLRQRQFDLGQAPDDLVHSLANEPLGEEAFIWLRNSWHGVRTQKIMVCTWCVGFLLGQGCVIKEDQANALVNRGLARNMGGARVMISVAWYFGEHFGLLVPGEGPTQRFHQLFG